MLKQYPLFIRIMTKKTRNAKKPSPRKQSKPKTNYRQRLREIFSQNTGQKFSLKQIFKMLKIRNKASKIKVVEDLEVLSDREEVVFTREGDLKSKHLDAHTGTVDFVNPRFAFIISDEFDEDIWVNSDHLKYALDGDKVLFRILPKNRGKKLEGEVLDIIERRRSEFVGKIELSERYAFVIADNRKMHLDIFVPNQSINGARNGEKVIVKVVEWHTKKNSPVGVVKEVLGKAGSHETEMHAILAEFDLPLRFPAPVVAEANKMKLEINRKELQKRRDFRKITTCTIDPDTAKDFDDALSIQALGPDRWEIGIHIADVTHYVNPGTALDEEASKRATSVYLVDRVVPMLPEVLSNNLCSLRPHEDRFTFSAVFDLDAEGNIHKEWYGRTIIHSDRRFTYEEAQVGIETGQGDYAKELHILNTIAKKLTEKRFDKGAVNFETTEVKFRLDEQGKPLGIFIKERKDAHRLIEEFMLLANRKVAEFVFKMGKKSAPKAMVYRVHEKPDVDKLKNFSVFARKFGYNISTVGKGIARSINQLVDKTQGSPQQDVLQTLAIRTMAKARYTTEAIGHFGLAFEHYTHFTSPIRRYPDMLVHRLLYRYLHERPSVDQQKLESISKHSTDMEKRAADAERASIKYKQVEFMQYQEDKEFEGVVTGVTEWGIYVEIVETKCEGMVRMSDMLDDFYDLDAENYRVVGRKTKNLISFGDSVQVRIKEINLEKRTMDLIMT